MGQRYGSTPEGGSSASLLGISCTSASMCTAAGYYKPKEGESKGWRFRRRAKTEELQSAHHPRNVLS